MTPPEDLAVLVERMTNYERDMRELRADVRDMHRAVDTLVRQGEQARIAEHARARMLAEADAKRAKELSDAAQLLANRKLASEIKWTPVQRGMAIAVVIFGAASLILEVYLNVFVGVRR